MRCKTSHTHTPRTLLTYTPQTNNTRTHHTYTHHTHTHIQVTTHGIDPMMMRLFDEIMQLMQHDPSFIAQERLDLPALGAHPKGIYDDL